MSLPPGNWGAPPEGNRSRLFLDNEKHTVFWEIPCGQQGGTGVRLPGGERNHLLTTVTQTGHEGISFERDTVIMNKILTALALLCGTAFPFAAQTKILVAKSRVPIVAGDYPGGLAFPTACDEQGRLYIKLIKAGPGMVGPSLGCRAKASWKRSSIRRMP